MHMYIYVCMHAYMCLSMYVCMHVRSLKNASVCLTLDTLVRLKESTVSNSCSGQERTNRYESPRLSSLIQYQLYNQRTGGLGCRVTS